MAGSKFEVILKPYPNKNKDCFNVCFFIHLNAEIKICKCSFFVLNLLFWSLSFLLSLSPFRLSFSPLFQLKNISCRERGKVFFGSSLPTILSSSRLPFHFLKHTPRLIASKPQPRRLLLCSLTNFDSSRRRVKLISLSPLFIFLGNTVVLDYVMFFRCSLFFNLGRGDDHF